MNKVRRLLKATELLKKKRMRKLIGMMKNLTKLKREVMQSSRSKSGLRPSRNTKRLSRGTQKIILLIVTEPHVT